MDKHEVCGGKSQDAGLLMFGEEVRQRTPLVGTTR